jgi:ribosome-associated heat shock protein Hsp15
MTDKKKVRIDKFLWAVRIFKTRNLSADACRMGRILIANNPAKPSRAIEANEILIVKKPPVIYTYRVIEPIENRISAKLTVEYIEDMTPENEKIKLDIHRAGVAGYRKKGSGRPTKRERRVIDKWKDGTSNN